MEHERDMFESVWPSLSRAYPTGPSGRRLEGTAGTVARWKAPAGGTSSPAVAPGVKLTGLQGGTGYTPAGRLDGGEPLGKKRTNVKCFNNLLLIITELFWVGVGFLKQYINRII